MERVRKRGKSVREEDVMQRAIVNHYKSRAAKGVIMIAIPNGGFRKPIEAAIMQGTGTRKGASDMLWIKNGQSYFLENKKIDGALKKEQIEFLEEAEGAGAICHVAYGLNDALRWLEERGLLVGKFS